MKYILFSGRVNVESSCLESMADRSTLVIIGFDVEEYLSFGMVLARLKGIDYLHR